MWLGEPFLPAQLPGEGGIGPAVAAWTRKTPAAAGCLPADKIQAGIAVADFGPFHLGMNEVIYLYHERRPPVLIVRGQHRGP